MPNVAPRGLHARVASTWQTPNEVFARVVGAWTPVQFVWAFHNGAWQLIWARAAVAPATATATWVQPATIRIDWTAPAVNPNSQWTVRRGDGSVVGVVPVGTLTITDTRPLLATESLAATWLAPYTVEGGDGVTTSAPRVTNWVDYGLAPATLTNTVWYPNPSSAWVTLNWTPNAGYGRPQGWRIALAGEPPNGEVIDGAATSTIIPGRPRGTNEDWRIVPVSQNPDGTWVQAGDSAPTRAYLKATPPPNVIITATTSPRQNLRLEWWHPTGGRNGYEVEVYHAGDPGTFIPHQTIPPNVTFSDWGTVATGFMRVRTMSIGGPSDWVQAGPTTPLPP